jgi:hypothetical protein
LFGGFSVFKAELCRRNEVNPEVTSTLMHRERQHDGGFLSQNGSQRRNENGKDSVKFVTVQIFNTNVQTCNKHQNETVCKQNVLDLLNPL